VRAVSLRNGLLQLNPVEGGHVNEAAAVADIRRDKNMIALCNNLCVQQSARVLSRERGVYIYIYIYVSMHIYPF